MFLVVLYNIIFHSRDGPKNRQALLSVFLVVVVVVFLHFFDLLERFLFLS